MEYVIITVYNKTNSQIIDIFVSEFEDMNELFSKIADLVLYYDVPYSELGWNYEIY